MSERRAATKGRRLGSSRRKQLRESSGEAPAPAPSLSEEPPWASEIVQRVQQLLSDRDTEQVGIVTREDVQRLQEEGLPCSREELQLVFDGLDAAGTGHLGTEEFTAGLRQFLSSQTAAREHRRRKTASRRVRLVLPSPGLPGPDSEERRHFAAFMEQLGTGNLSEEQEIWQLWVKLRQDEPQLLDNLEEFLAKMRHRIQEARSEKEALELALNKRVAEHDKDVQQLCEVLEQQIQQEQLRLQQQSTARSQQQGEELQRVLEASEREVQRLVTAQMELERRCRSLQSSQQVTSTENRQLEESNRALEQHLQLLHQQLQHTQGRLRTMRATVVWENTGEPGGRVVAELPMEVPMSPQLSPASSEKFRSEMRIRLGSQSSESKAKGTHQVVWEVLPAEIHISGAPRKASSAEEDPFPESLKEEGVSDQNSLLREMNDAIAALSKHLKSQALGAPPALADTPWDNAEPQTGPEATTAHETTPGVLQETLPGHIHHELLEGDLQEGPATAELGAPDVTQAGASTGAGHCTAQEPEAEQGDSPEEAHRMLFLQGKGAGVEEMVLNVAEHLGESIEAGEQVLMEVEGAERLQEKTAWAKPQLLGEAEELEMRQRENLEARLGPPEAGQEGIAEGQCLGMDEQQPGRTLGECGQAPGTALQEWAEPALGLETELGEYLEPEPPSWGKAQVEAAHGGGVPEVTVAPGPGELDEERARMEVQPQGETTDSKVLEVLPAPTEHAESSRAGGEEEEVEEAEPREAEQQLQGECARGGAGWRGSTGTLEPLAVAVPLTHGQGGVGTDVELMEAQSSTNTELLVEVEADLQVWNEAGTPRTEQEGSVDSEVQALDQEDKEEFLERDAEDVQEDMMSHESLSPGAPWGEEGERAVQVEEEEDGAQGQGEHGLPQEPVLDLQGSGVGHSAGADGDTQAQEEAERLDTAEEQGSGANVQLIAEGDELTLTPGGSTGADLQPLGEAGSSGTEQGGRLNSSVHLLDQVNKAELVEGEAEDAQADLQLCGGFRPEIPWGREGGRAVQIEEDEEEDGAQRQSEHRLPHEPVPHPNGVILDQGEGAGASLKPGEEAERLDTVEDQSSGANVQLIAGGDELRVTPGGSTGPDLQPLGEAGSSGTEQGGRLNSDVHLLDQVNKAELVEGEADDTQADLQLCGGFSPETSQGGKGERAVQHQDNEEQDGAQGQGEHRLPHEPVPHPSGVTLDQGEGAGEEAERLDTVEDQSSGANVQLIAEGDELTLTPGGSTGADLQPLGEAGSSGTEQGGSVDSEVQPLDQEDKAELVEVEEEGVQEGMMSHEGLSPEAPWGGDGEKAVQVEEEEHEAQGQCEHGLPQEPVLDLQGSGLRQGERAGEGMKAQEEAERLDTAEDQSSGANVQLIAEGNELKSASAESTEADLLPLSQTDSMGTEQGGNGAPDVHPLDQEDKEELVDMEAEDSWTDNQLCVTAGPETPQAGGHCAAVQPRDGAGDWGQGQGGHGLMQELMPHPSGVTIRQRRGTDAGVQPGEEAERLDTVEDQSSGANVQLIAEGDELTLTPGGSTGADVQPLGEAGSSGTEQGGNVDSEVQPLHQEDKAELVEGEAEDAQEDTQLSECLSSGVSWQGEIGTNVQVEEEDNGAQGQGEGELPQEPVMDLQGSGLRQGERAGEGMQAQGEAESLDTTEDQSSGANVQLIAEGKELRVTPGGSTGADLQPLGEAGSSGTEQGGSVDSEVQPLDQEDKEEFLERDAEDVQEDMMSHESLSPGAPWGEEGERAVQVEEEEDGAQGQCEHGLPQEPVLDLQGSGVGHSAGADGDTQAQEEAERLDTAEEQGSGAEGHLIAEGDELTLTPGGSTGADLQPLGEAGSSGTEQGGRLNSDVHLLDQVNKAELVEGEAEDAQADLQLCGGFSPETPQGGKGERAVQHQDNEEQDGAQGQGEHRLPYEPVPHPSGVTLDQGEGAGEEAERLDTVKDPDSGANVEPIAEGEEPRVTPGGSTEAESLGTEQGGRLNSSVHLLDQVNKAELVEGEAEDAQADLQLCGGLSPGAPWGGEGGRAIQNEEDDEDGAHVQGENGLPQESVLGPEGARGQQGDGAGAGVQPQEGESLDTLETQSTDADVQLFPDQQKPKSGSGGSTEADLTPLGVAGMWEGQQSLTQGLEAVLAASPTANPWEGAAAADVPPPTEAALCPGPVTAAQGPGLEAKLGACIGPEGQVLQGQELLQGERAPAEGKPLGGAHSLELAQGERLEAGLRNGVKTQGLGLNQGHNDAALASLVSEVPVQISPLKLETMMQEDVLIPDVWRLCAPGQAAQRELQEQVSAQGHERRLHTEAQQPDKETPPTMEPKHTAAGPAECPKQEVPPASTLHTTAQPERAGRDQMGMVLRDNSLGQRQLLGEQSKDLGDGQREKMQEFGQKMSQECKPSPGEPGALTAGGAGAAPRGCPKAPLDPDHLYNVLFVGDSHVGKTSFLYRLHADTFNPHLAATVGLDYQIKTLVVDNKSFALRLWDSAGQERYRSMTKQFFRKADGVVLMYDITSEYSFSDVRYWLSCIQEAAEDGVAVLLLGNKTDCAAQRQVPAKEGECLAKEHQLMFYECSAASGHNVFESMVSFVRLLKSREDELKNKTEEVPKAPEKKKSCCW